MSEKIKKRVHPNALIPEKVEFIKLNFPDIDKINPYTNSAFIDKVKLSLFNGGHYSKLYFQANAGINSAVLNLIIRAQNKKPTKFQPTSLATREL